MSNEEEGWIAEFEAAGEDEVRIRLYRRHASGGKISRRRSFAARAGTRAQTSRRRDASLRLVDFMRCRSVGDRGRRRTDGDVVWTLSGPRLSTRRRQCLSFPKFYVHDSCGAAR